MQTITIVTLVMVLLTPNGKAKHETREMLSVEACKAAEKGAHEAIKYASDYIDVGTICVTSEFQPDAVKPNV